MKNCFKLIIIFLCISPFQLIAEDMISLNRSLVDRQIKSISVLANYSYFDLWIPSKYGLTASYTPSAQATYDLEFLRGNLSLAWFIDDLGSFTDQRWSLLRRSFNGRNSLNFILGAFYTKTNINIGSDYLTNITPQTDYNLLSTENIGITLGFGNRWVTKSGFTIGADWLSINIPVHNLKTNDSFIQATLDPSHKNLAEDVIKIFKNIPGVVAFKIQFGYSF